MQDLESAEPQKVFTANPGFPWPLLFKILVGVVLFANLCTLAIFSLETPELIPEPNREVLKTLNPYPKAQAQLPLSYTTNILEGYLYSATCGLMDYLIVYDYRLKACADDGFWEDFAKFDQSTLYSLVTGITAFTVLLIVFLYYKYPRLIFVLCVIGAIVFIGLMVVVGRNNVPARGGNTLSVLHRFINPDVNFLDYRAMLGFGTFIGAKLAKQTYAVEPHPIYFDKLNTLVNKNDLTDGVEMSNLCISDGVTLSKDFIIHLEEVDRNKVKVESESDITQSVNCVTLPDFISFNQIQPPLFISFDVGEREESLKVIASWAPWLKSMDEAGVAKPVFYVSVYSSSEDSKELRQEVCDVLNSFDLVFIDHHSFRVTQALTPETLCASCRYIIADTELLDYYQINTKAHDSMPSGNDQTHDTHGDAHGGH